MNNMQWVAYGEAGDHWEILSTWPVNSDDHHAAVNAARDLADDLGMGLTVIMLDEGFVPGVIYGNPAETFRTIEAA